MSRFEPLAAFPKSPIQIGRENKDENVHLLAFPGKDLGIKHIDRSNEEHNAGSAT